MYTLTQFGIAMKVCGYNHSLYLIVYHGVTYSSSTGILKVQYNFLTLINTCSFDVDVCE